MNNTSNKHQQKYINQIIKEKIKKSEKQGWDLACAGVPMAPKIGVGLSQFMELRARLATCQTVRCIIALVVRGTGQITVFSVFLSVYLYLEFIEHSHQVWVWVKCHSLFVYCFRLFLRCIFMSVYYLTLLEIIWPVTSFWSGTLKFSRAPLNSQVRGRAGSLPFLAKSQPWKKIKPIKKQTHTQPSKLANEQTNKQTNWEIAKQINE